LCRFSILVLKDGQIYEQGNFKELMELNGLFASMWINQVSSSDDPVASIADNAIKNEISGYIVDTAATEEIEETQVAASENVEELPEETITEIIPSEVIELSPSGPEEPAPAEPIVTSPVPFPSEDVPAPEVPVNSPLVQESNVSEPVIYSPTPISSPVAFPTSGDDQSDVQSEVTPAPATETSAAPVVAPAPVRAPAGVTFGTSVNSPPSRTGTPDPESEPKRKRISSQNFQRLARRISLTTRRPSSSNSIIPSLPGFKRDQSPRVSTDDANANSTAGPSNNSPAASLTGDDAKGKLKKKDKKDKNRKGTL
jgi:hypothetical protein